MPYTMTSPSIHYNIDNGWYNGVLHIRGRELNIIQFKVALHNDSLSCIVQD